MTTNNKISNLVSSQVPFFVRNDHANFIRFLEAYYEFLEQEGGLIDTAKNILSYRDIDQSVGVFEQKLYDTFLKGIPSDVVVDKAFLLKHVKDFYRARGSEKSIRFLLGILFGEQDVEFYYPKKDVLRVSDGKWYVQKSLRVSNLYVNGSPDATLVGLNRFVNRTVTGNTSGATATVERVDRFYERGTEVEELIITDILGTFENGEQVFSLFEDTNGSLKSVTANVFGGILNTISITNGGSNYVVGTHPPVEGGSGTGGNVRIDKVSTGGVASISVVEGGAGYQTNTFALFSGGGGSGANAEITLVLGDSSVHPNSYNIAYSTISLEANTNVTNSTANGIYESFAYQNLNIIYTNTSNLLANTYTSLSSINLTSWKANSNVYFETYDSLNLTNQVSGVTTTVLITSSNTISNTVYISPAFATAQKNLTIKVLKRANANTTIANSLQFFVYANTGPIRTVAVRDAGNNYTSLPTISFVANTRIKELQILGRMVIANSGSGYAIGNSIEFINAPGGYGTGAAGNVTNVNATGGITEVKFVPVSGQITGGSGYNVLPTANVISGTGTGAVITVTQRLGEGGSFILANTSLGAIEQISILNRGTGYTSPPTINLRALGDGTATANATILQGVYTYPGRYLNDDGFISSYNFLQDRDYYQNFSYVVRIRESIANYRKALKELTHPAGAKLFGSYILEDNATTVVSNSSINDATVTSIPTPTLSLDFTTGTLDSNVTFTRASSGTYVNSNGYIVTASTNVPRFTYNPVNLAPRGLLIEPQSTNLLLQSSNLKNGSVWGSYTGANIISNITSPDGSNNAYILTDNLTTQDTTYIEQQISITPSATNRYTLSIFAKANTSNEFSVYAFFIGSSVAGNAITVKNFDKERPTITGFAAEGGVNPTNVKLERYNKGWYKASFTVYDNNSLNNKLAFRIFPATRDANKTGNTIFYGPQLEAGNTVSSYIPTTSATVTRSRDIATVEGTAFSNVYNQSEGTLFAQGIMPSGNNGGYPIIVGFANSYSTDSNTIHITSLKTSITGSGSITGEIYRNNAAEFPSSWLYYNPGSIYKAAITYKTNDAITYVDANSSTYDSSVTLPNVNALYIAGELRYQTQFPQTISKVFYYNKRLANSTLQSITTRS